MDKRSIATTALDLVASVLAVAGAALVYVPAAFIVAAILLGVVSWRLTPREVDDS